MWVLGSRVPEFWGSGLRVFVYGFRFLGFGVLGFRGLWILGLGGFRV